MADLLDPDDYAASQIYGAQRRAAGANGITWPSVRYPGGSCIAAFWPDVVPIPTQGRHFAYHWDGAAVDYVKRLDTGATMRVFQDPNPVDAIAPWHAMTPKQQKSGRVV